MTMPSTNVIVTTITRNFVPGSGKPHLFKNSWCCCCKTIVFSTNSPIFKINPATKPPSRTRPKLILAMSVSFFWGIILELEREDDYHRIDGPTSKSEPPAVAGGPAFNLDVQ